MKLSLLVLISCLIFACKTSEKHYEGNSLLYKIEGNGIKGDAYVFGTIHLISKDNFSFPPTLEDLIISSDTIVMEIGDLNPMEAMKHLLLEEGSFFDYFNVGQKDSILDWAKKEMNMEPELFEMAMGKMKPFAVVQMATQLQGIEDIESYELTISKKANANKKPIKGLETIEQQISFFDDMDSSMQTEMVMEAIRGNTEEDLLKTLESIYLTQDIDSMHRFIQTEGGSIAAEEETLLINRNKDWVPQIINLAKSCNVFIAVGAGHLGGPDGLIQLLKKEGFTVTPIKLTL